MLAPRGLGEPQWLGYQSQARGPDDDCPPNCQSLFVSLPTSPAFLQHWGISLAVSNTEETTLTIHWIEEIEGKRYRMGKSNLEGKLKAKEGLARWLSRWQHTTKAKDLDSIPKTQMMGGENQLPLGIPNPHHICTHCTIKQIFRAKEIYIIRRDSSR